jgi:hypothetical protein
LDTIGSPYLERIWPDGWSAFRHRTRAAIRIAGSTETRRAHTRRMRELGAGDTFRLPFLRAPVRQGFRPMLFPISNSPSRTHVLPAVADRGAQ